MRRSTPVIILGVLLMLVCGYLLMFQSGGGGGDVFDTASPGARNGPEKVGTIRGTVLDHRSGEPVAGALLEVRGMSISNSTQADGSYELNLVPEGIVYLDVAFEDHETESYQVVVTNGSVVQFDIRLGRPAAKEEAEDDSTVLIIATVVIVGVLGAVLLYLGYSKWVATRHKHLEEDGEVKSERASRKKKK